MHTLVYICIYIFKSYHTQPCTSSIHITHTYTPTHTKLRTRGAAQFPCHTRTRRQRAAENQDQTAPHPKADSSQSPTTHLLHNPSPQVDKVLSRRLLVQLGNGFARLLQGLDGHLPLLFYRHSLGGSLAWARLEPPTASCLALQERAASATQHTPKAAASTCAVRIVSVNKPLPCHSASE